MTEDKLQFILNHLPLDQHEEARYTITRAELNGIEDIGLWTGEELPDVSDLVGNKECDPWTFDFDGEKITMNTSMIWLMNYKFEH